MKAICTEVRYLAIADFLKHHNWEKTCGVFYISRSSLFRFTKMYGAGNNLEPKIKIQPKHFTHEQRSYVVGLVQTKHYMTVSRMAACFARRYKEQISSRTIRRILKSNGVVYKTMYVGRKVKKRTRRFHKAIRGLPLKRLLSVDEMGFTHSAIHPKKTWCAKNIKNKIYRNKGTRFENINKTVTCITSTKEVVHYEWQYRAMNTASFSKFLRTALTGYTGYYLILDNISFHKSKKVLETLNELGVTPVYIDPRTPEQNPIEEMFSSVKHYVRSKSPNTEERFSKYLNIAMCRQKPYSLIKYFCRAVAAQV